MLVSIALSRIRRQNWDTQPLFVVSFMLLTLAFFVTLPVTAQGLRGGEHWLNQYEGLTGEDIALMEATARERMDDHVVGSRLGWVNPDSRSRGIVKIQSITIATDGEECRRLQHAVEIGATKNRFLHETLICRLPGEAWRQVE